MVRERQVSAEEKIRDQNIIINIIKNTPGCGKHVRAYIYGNLTPNSTVGTSAFKMYEKHHISGYWSFVEWVPMYEVDENKEFIPEQLIDYY